LFDFNEEKTGKMAIRVSEKIDKELNDAIMKLAKALAKKGKKKKKV
jgi:hypothetical protein